MCCDIVFIICTIAIGNIYVILVITVMTVVILLMTFVMIVAVTCCIVQQRRKRQPGIWNYNKNKFILNFYHIV